MAKTGSKCKKPSARSPKGKKPLSQRERNALMQMMRLVYCWRYVCHELAEKGLPIPESDHGYNLLAPATPEKINAAYTLASHKPLVWQVLVVCYAQSAQGEYRSWAWVKSEVPIIAAGEGITPLLAQANDIAMSDVEESDHCYARATIMAPYDAQHPVRPDRLAARLQTKLRLSKEEVLALQEWESPQTVSVAVDNIDLEIAKALRAAEG